MGKKVDSLRRPGRGNHGREQGRRRGQGDTARSFRHMAPLCEVTSEPESSRHASIQRLWTVGGKAPADGGCAAHAGAEARVPYNATYVLGREALNTSLRNGAFAGLCAGGCASTRGKARRTSRGKTLRPEAQPPSPEYLPRRRSIARGTSRDGCRVPAEGDCREVKSRPGRAGNGRPRRANAGAGRQQPEVDPTRAGTVMVAHCA